MGMGLEMLDQIQNAPREDRNLNLGRSGITGVDPILLYDRAFFLRGKGHSAPSSAFASAMRFFLFLCYPAKYSRQSRPRPDARATGFLAVDLTGRGCGAAPLCRRARAS